MKKVPAGGARSGVGASAHARPLHIFTDKSTFTGEVLKFRSKNGDGVVIDTYTSRKGGRFFCELGAEAQAPAIQGKVNLKFDTNKMVELSAESDKVADGLKIKGAAKYAAYKGAFKAQTDKKKYYRQVNADVSYKQDFVSAQVKVNSLVDSSLVDAEVSATIGDSGLSIGGKYPIALDLKDLGKTARPPLFPPFVGVEWRLKNLTATMLTSPGQEVKLGFLQTVSDKTKIAAQYVNPKDEGKAGGTTLELAASYKLSKDTNVYGTFKSDGQVKATVEKSFAQPDLTASLTFGMDLAQGAGINGPFGLMVKLGDN